MEPEKEKEKRKKKCTSEKNYLTKPKVRYQSNSEYRSFLPDLVTFCTITLSPFTFSSIIETNS